MSMNSFYQKDVDKDLKRLQDAITTKNPGVVNFIQEKYHSFLPFDTMLTKRLFGKNQTHTFSSYLLPRDIPHHLAPIRTTSDGDCFYNSASILLVGNESLSPVLRILIAAEIFLHDTFYVNHPRYECRTSFIK